MKQFSMTRMALSAFGIALGAVQLFAQGVPAAPAAPKAPAPPPQLTETRNVYRVYRRDWDPTLVEGAHNPCRVFIGVGTMTYEGRLEVSYTVDNTPAETYGIRENDVILAIDNVPVKTQAELERQRDTHQPGDDFTLTILRNGAQQTVNLKFKACTEEEKQKAAETFTSEFDADEFSRQMEKLAEEMAKLDQEMANLRIHLDRMPALEHLAMGELRERPILGFYPDESRGVAGMLVGNVISGKGAEAAGIQRGDVITEINGKSVNGPAGLRSLLGSHKAGDVVAVTYERDGRTYRTDVTLSSEKTYAFNHRVERDPCEVFIGVYTAETGNGLGVRVNGVIDNTPAKDADIQPGDIITALDGAPVSNYQQLTAERDKHEPGDPFQLSILRNGAPMIVDAVFKTCDKEEPAKPAVVEEKVTVLEEKSPAPQNDPVLLQNNVLELADLNVFPNPTYGPLNVRFEAEAAPITVRIFDINGKVVYDKALNQFSGLFDEKINLVNNKPGNYVLQVQQNGKTFAKTIVLLPRA